jgi:DNA-binding LacI/PurR family transcriptional regulator
LPYKTPRTIRDVAKRASVAKICVSKRVNNFGHAVQATHERMLAAIAEPGYVPNTLARSLCSSCTTTPVLILTDVTNPLWAAAWRRPRAEKYVQTALQQQADGVILVSSSSAPNPMLSSNRRRRYRGETRRASVLIHRPPWRYPITASKPIVGCPKSRTLNALGGPAFYGPR